MIPVRVGDQEVSVAARPSGQQRLTQSVDAGAAIEDNQRAVVAPNLNTRRVAPVAQRDSTRLG
jgi:hypothetical protein